MRLTKRRNRRIAHSKRPRWWLLFVPVLVLCAWDAWKLLDARRAPAVERGAPLTEADLRGETSSGAPLVGRLGPEGVELTGSVAACARCHGPRGKGTGEGANIPSSRLFAPVSTAAPGSGPSSVPGAGWESGAASSCGWASPPRR